MVVSRAGRQIAHNEIYIVLVRVQCSHFLATFFLFYTHRHRATFDCCQVRGVVLRAVMCGLVLVVCCVVLFLLCVCVTCFFVYRYRIHDLLMYSAVCGLGLDTVLTTNTNTYIRNIQIQYSGMLTRFPILLFTSTTC